jgi:hypothetical protein
MPWKASSVMEERLRSLGRLASESKCLAQSNKSGDGGRATKRQSTKRERRVRIQWKTS